MCDTYIGARRNHLAAPILVVENAMNATPTISSFLTRAEFDNPILVLPDAEKAARYLETTGNGQARDLKTSPVIGIWDVTCPVLGTMDAPGWLTLPSRRQIIFADLRNSGINAHFAPGMAFGNNAVLCNFSSDDALLAALKKLRKTLIASEELSGFLTSLRAA